MQCPNCQFEPDELGRPQHAPGCNPLESFDPDHFRAQFLTAAAPDQPHLAIAPGASGVYNCGRRQFYTLQGQETSYTRTDVERGEGMMNSKMGNAIEPEVYEVLHKMGYKVRDAQMAWCIMSCDAVIRAKNDEVLKITMKGHQDGFLSGLDVHGKPLEQHLEGCFPIQTGHPDGILEMDGYPPVLLEIKFLRARSFVDIRQGTIGTYEPGLHGQNYWAQVLSNMYALGLPAALWLVFAKDSSMVKWMRRQWKFYDVEDGKGFMHVEMVPFNEELHELAMQRARIVTQYHRSNDLPSRDFQPEGSNADWQCRYCPFQQQCLDDGEKEL